MASLDPPGTAPVDRTALRAELVDTVHLLDAARANLKDALREEGEALAGACEAVNATGAVSKQAATALRTAQTAHARSTAAAGEVRSLSAEAERVNAAAEAPVPDADPSPA